MGSGKTSVAKWVGEVLTRDRSGVCAHCRLEKRGDCAHVIISRDFNTYAHVGSKEGVEDLFKRDLLAVVFPLLLQIFGEPTEVEKLRGLVMQRPTDSELARFHGFVTYIDQVYDWANLQHEQKAERLLKYVERRLPDDERRPIDEQLLYAMTLLAYVRREIRRDPACMVFIFDNIDGVRPEMQLALLQIILSVQATAHIRTLVPLRLTTFEMLESNAAFAFGHIDHAGPGAMEIVRHRLIWWQQAWHQREEVQALEPRYRDALKRRLDYFLSLWDQPPRIVESLGALCGASIRLGLYLMERVFLNNVMRYDEEVRYHDEVLRAVLVDNSTEEAEMSAQDQFVVNLFADPTDNSMSLVLLRILQVAYALKDRAGERTVTNVLKTVQTADPSFTDDVVWRALNLLLFNKAPLVWVDGRDRYLTAKEAVAAFDVINLTEAGRRYFEILVRDLMYVQEALMSVSWPPHAVGRFVDYKRASSRFTALRSCLQHIMNVDTEHIGNWSDGQNRRAARMSIDGDLISNRIAYNVGRALLGIIRTSEFDNPLAALQDWKNLIINGFNNEWDTLRRENLKMIELTEEFNKEILARGGQISVAAPSKPSSNREKY
jgi:hypothetical protein